MADRIEVEGDRHGDLGVMRQRLELAMEGAQLGVWSFNPTTGALWYSARSREIYGLGPDEPLDSVTLRTRVHPDDWGRLAAPYINGFPDEHLAIEYRIIRPNGEVRWIYALGAAAEGEEGAARAVHGIHLDVTERKHAEEMLDETRRQLGMALESADLGTWTIDPHSGEVWYSDRSRELYGLERQLPLDVQSLKRYIHPEDWPRVLEPFALGFPSDTISIEHRVVRADGGTRWVYSRGAALRDESGTVQMLSGIHMDITRRKQAEVDLARSRDALLQSEKLAAMGALLAGVSHELNNPLAAIVGQSEMLKEDAAGTVFEERAKKIAAAAERCARIVQTFLAMARRRETQAELVSMNDLIATALELTEYALRTAGIAVRVNFGTGLPPVEGDKDQLHQVLVNLIVNAQQAMEKGEAFEKVLTVRTSVDQAGRILVDVTDTGPGIPDSVRHRIFEPFFTTKRAGGSGGTGIGLSFSQGIVEAHGGTLEIEPSRRGAHFRIALPPAAAAPAPVVVPDEAVVLPEIVATRRTALIVEDEPDVADTLRELIEREGFDVTVAGNGAEAFHALDRGEFDLLFSDLRMPVLGGPELYARLKEVRPQLVERMAFVTGDTMGDSMGDFLKDAGRPILEKPFTRAGVRAVLAALVVPGEAG